MRFAAIAWALSVATALAAGPALSAEGPGGGSGGGGGGRAAPRFGTVRYFYPHCKAILDENNNEEPFRQGQCSGEMLALSSVSEQLATNFRFCSPSGTQAGELAEVATKYFDQHPEKMDAEFIDTVIQAYRIRWPCRK